jgi:hypothetical protein
MEHTMSHPPFSINIEGTSHDWPLSTITTEQIAVLGGWQASAGVIEVDQKSGSEVTLAPGQVVELKPGQGVGKKVLFRRGDHTHRIALEIAMLRQCFPDLEIDATSTWVRIPAYKLTEGWSPSIAPLSFQIPSGYPGAPPYGFYLPAGVRHRGRVPGNYTEPAAQSPPFGGSWGFFSWTWETRWCPAAEVTRGPNLVNWALGFHQRLAEGA